MNLTRPLTALVCLASLLSSFAGDKPSAAKEGSGELDLSAFPGQVMDDVIIPIPSEIFSVLDKLGDPDWKREIITENPPKFTDRTDIALLLGTVVADGFIAVQAEDAKSVENIGREVLDLSKILGVKDAVLPHCNAIQDASKRNDWEVVRKELDATQKTVRDQMEKMKDAALAECVSVGGWLRGTMVVTNIIGHKFSQEAAELLNQAELADYFRDNIEEAITKLPKPDKLKLISSGLAQIHDIMLRGGDALDEEGVATIQRITSELVNRITTKN